MHAYLIGALVLAAVYWSLFIARKDLRWIMLYSGLLYVIFTTPCFILLRLITSDPAKSVTPGYWSPSTLFDLGQKTGGYAIEDLLFIFFAGGIAAGLYEFVFNIKVDKRSDKRLKKSYALGVGLLAGFTIFAFTPLNAIYFLIFLQFFGALALIWQRRDLLMHSIAGGLLFLIFYGLLFSIFNLLFPTFVRSYDHLEHTSHILFLGIPLEEYLYALSLGMLWAPLYEYEHKVKDVKQKSKKFARHLRLTKFS